MCKKINYAKCTKNNRKLEFFGQKTHQVETYLRLNLYATF